MKRNIIFTLLAIILNWLLIALFATIFFFVGATAALLGSRILFDTASEGGLALAGYTLVGGLAGCVLSLLPSYKLSLKLAKIMEKKWNVSIPHPARLFALSLLLPILLLLLAGLLT